MNFMEVEEEKEEEMGAITTVILPTEATIKKGLNKLEYGGLTQGVSSTSQAL